MIHQHEQEKEQECQGQLDAQETPVADVALTILHLNQVCTVLFLCSDLSSFPGRTRPQLHLNGGIDRQRGQGVPSIFVVVVEERAPSEKFQSWLWQAGQ